MHMRISVGSGQACLPRARGVGGWGGAPARRMIRRGTQAVPVGTAVPPESNVIFS
jgi:hypothetical protein